LIALGFRLPILALVLCGGLCAILLGYENGLAITTASDKPLFLMGLTVAALVVVCLVTAGLTQLRSIGKAIPIAMRAVGSWIAAVAIILFALGPAA
jgi:hydrogenase/urease accessory protein HupE